MKKETSEETKILALRPRDLAQALRFCIRARQPPMVHGDPGVGKSEIMMQVADKLFAEAYGYTISDAGVVLKPSGKPLGQRSIDRPWFRDIRTALLDPVDLRGLPHVRSEKRKSDGEIEHKAFWAIPGFLPVDARGGVFFFDEINRGSEMTMNGCFSLVLSGELGEYKMPRKWVCSAAVNDLDAGARKMSGALQSRFRHFDLVPHLNDVLDYSMKLQWHPAIVGFLKFRAELLSSFDPKVRVSPNPRSWGFLSGTLELMEEDEKISPRAERALIAGTVGEGAEIEFSAYLQTYRKLPSYERIVKKPKTTNVPKEPSLQFALALLLARKVQKDDFKRVALYIKRMDTEYNVLSVMRAVTRDAQLTSSEAFLDWCTQNTQVVL